MCAALVRYKTSVGHVREGICTSWLEKMEPTETDEFSVPIFVRRNQGFRLPRKAVVPIIMIGPGTGLAPFRGFIQQRAALISEGTFFFSLLRSFDCSF